MNAKLVITITVIIVVLIGTYFVLENYDTSSTHSLTDSGRDTPSIAENPDINLNSADRYLDYSKSSFDQAVGKKRILFFHATWCPTCKIAHQELSENSRQIPKDLVIFKTDYDRETQLKQRYGITYQHTFVYVDDAGQAIKTWNGGGLTEIIAI